MRIALDIRYWTSSGASTYIENIIPRLLYFSEKHKFVLIRFKKPPINGIEQLESIISPQWSEAAQVV